MMTDTEVSEGMAMLRRMGVTVHIRGTDDRPVIEFKDKRTGRIVGGVELKKRMASA